MRPLAAGAVVLAALCLTATAAGQTAPQPYLRLIDEPTVFPALQPVTVAVLDAGVDGQNPDLAGQIAGSHSFTGADPLYPLLIHGTATAGLIAAIRGNDLGIDGIAPNASLLSVAVAPVDNPDQFDQQAINDGIRWAADQGARVISLSLGGYGQDPGEQAAVDYATTKGALVVVAAGNCWGGREQDWAGCPFAAAGYYPAWLDHVLTVGATGSVLDSQPQPADFSIPSARFVDLAAPGQLITTLWPTRNNPYYTTPDCAFLGSSYCYWQPQDPWGLTGTSYATPQVAAAAAILFGVDPRLRPDQVAALLESAAQPLPDPAHQLGHGLLDVSRALQLLAAGQAPPADYGEPNEVRPASWRHGRALAATIDWSHDPIDAYLLPAPSAAFTISSQGPSAELSVYQGSRLIARGRLGQRLLIPAAPTNGHRSLRLLVSAGPAAAGPYRLQLSH